jgi:hypothetical protein
LAVKYKQFSDTLQGLLFMAASVILKEERHSGKEVNQSGRSKSEDGSGK